MNMWHQELNMQERNKKITKKSYISNNLEDTIEFAYNLAKNSKSGDIYCLEGDLGVGKTVIAKGMGKFFNVKENITSPTFTILKTYNLNNNSIKRLHHFDLYRIKNIEELLNIGFEEYINDKNSIIIIEWPEIAYELLPKNIKIIKISKVSSDSHDVREISIS